MKEKIKKLFFKEETTENGEVVLVERRWWKITKKVGIFTGGVAIGICAAACCNNSNDEKLIDADYTELPALDDDEPIAALENHEEGTEVTEMVTE